MTVAPGEVACSRRRDMVVASVTASMGDYRNELQSALSQVEALRAENAALRAKLRPPSATGADDPAFPLPDDVPRPRRPFTRQVIVGAVGVALVGAYALLAVPRRDPLDTPLRMPDAPTVPVASPPAAALPMPPTTVRLPEPHRSGAEPLPLVDEGAMPISPATVHTSDRYGRGVRWADPSKGLYVLTTVPEAQCTVGGVLFATPRPVLLGPGVYPVHCEVGRVRQTWQVQVAARQVTFDLDHRLGR